MFTDFDSMNRQDISKHLIHFTKDKNDECAFRRLQKIIRDKKLIGGSNMIMGNHRCVCFSEAPLPSLADGLVNNDHYSKYSSFGIMVSKQWLFKQGGRPVIYQPVAEYKLLSESHRWRHVTFELRETHSFSDFTWEREWRLRCDDLSFDCTTATIVVPDAKWVARIVKEHDDAQDYTVQMYSIVLGDVAENYRESFKWTVTPLR
jgi:hypothetical protein